MSAYNLGSVYDEIKGSLARGSTLDSAIPDMVRHTARWIERNYSLKYMERFAQFNVLVDSEQPRMIELPNHRIKSMRFLRLPAEGNAWAANRCSDGYFYLTKIEPMDQKTVPHYPDSYWQDGWSNLVLAAPVVSNTLFEIGFYEYSPWSTDRDSCHWLVDNCPDLLIAHTLMRFARRLRDERMYATYKTERDECLKTVLDADFEGNFQDQSPVMEYRGSFGERTR